MGNVGDVVAPTESVIYGRFGYGTRTSIRRS
jgi:hypothetical protein